MIKQNKFKVIVIILLMCISIGALTYSFGYVSKNDVVERESYFYVSEIKVGVNETSDSINLGKVIPTLDRFGILNDAFTFSITNNGDNEENYLLKLIDGDTISTIPNNALRYELTINGNVEGVYSLSNSGVIKTGIIKAKEKIDFGIKLWLSYDSDIDSGVWKKVISATAGNGNIDNSGANNPILDEGMIPVYYDSNKEAWCKAELDNTSKEYSWYDYDALIWANAVTVSKETRSNYMAASLGTEIKMDDITSMWVWIPRFKYTIFDNSTNPKEINVTFEKGLKSSGTVICTDELSETGSEVCIDNKNNGIISGVSTYTHPAFNYGDEKLEGIWVSKFEAGINSNNKCASDNNAINCNKEQEIMIKPGAFSLNYISMNNLYQSFNKMNNNSLYGLADSDVHMIKNTEWGAVAYLYYSKYGKLSNSEYGSKDKVIYSNPKKLTGYSNGNNGKEYFYNVNKLGTGASTTGNVYGIYDLAGGKGEIIMMNFQDTYGTFNTNKLIGNSEFNPDMKYYDIYSKQNDLNIMKLGDATKETKWFNNTQRIDYNNLMYRDNIFGINHIGVINNSNIGSRPTIKISSRNYITSIK